MKIDGRQMRTIWIERDGVSAGIIDQTQLPHRFVTVRLATLEDAARAIRTMQVRGAPLIGTTAAYGVWLASRADASDEALEKACSTLAATRPTAINLKWALDEMVAAVRNRPRNERPDAAFLRAGEIADEDVTINRAIGAHGLQIIEDIAAQRKRASPSMCSPIAMPAGWRPSIWERRPRRSMRRTIKGCKSMSSPTRPAAQSGGGADGLGVGPSRRAAHRYPGQYRRTSDATQDGRLGDRRRRPRDCARRRLQQDRHLSEGPCSLRQRGAILCRRTVTVDRFRNWARVRTFPSSSAPRRKSRL